MESGAGKYFVPPYKLWGLGILNLISPRHEVLSDPRNWAVFGLSLDRLSSDTHGNVRKDELRILNAFGREGR
jgi:hypothetical protein